MPAHANSNGSIFSGDLSIVCFHQYLRLIYKVNMYKPFSRKEYMETKINVNNKMWHGLGLALPTYYSATWWGRVLCASESDLSPKISLQLSKYESNIDSHFIPHAI